MIAILQITRIKAKESPLKTVQYESPNFYVNSSRAAMM